MQDVRPILNERFGLADGLKNIIQQASPFPSAGANKATAVPVDRPRHGGGCRYHFLESDDDDDDDV